MTVSSRQLVKDLGVKHSTLKSWVKSGLLRPSDDAPGRGGAYEFPDGETVLVRAVLLLNALGVRGQDARRIIDGARDSLKIGKARFDWTIPDVGVQERILAEKWPLLAPLLQQAEKAQVAECVLTLNLHQIEKVVLQALDSNDVKS